jgi:hypothetical protein
MRRLHEHWGREEIIDYNLRPSEEGAERGTSFTVFEKGQPSRVNLTRDAISKITRRHREEVMTMIEPGCSTGDVTGYFASHHIVWGNDVVPAAVHEARKRWPRGEWDVGVAEDFRPRECDILVICEFLEHIHDPITFVKDWMPLARYSIIGHPLVGDDHDPEQGHFWAYDIGDFHRWFEMAGHEIIHQQPFKMGRYYMILGVGRRT